MGDPGRETCLINFTAFKLEVSQSCYKYRRRLIYVWSAQDKQNFMVDQKPGF